MNFCEIKLENNFFTNKNTIALGKIKVFYNYNVNCLTLNIIYRVYNLNNIFISIKIPMNRNI